MHVNSTPLLLKKRAHLIPLTPIIIIIGQNCISQHHHTPTEALRTSLWQTHMHNLASHIHRMHATIYECREQGYVCVLYTLRRNGSIPRFI